MKINILLPHKEMFDKNNASAVSITIKNNLEYSCFRRSIKIYGQETANPISVDNFVGIKNPFFFFSSKNKNLAKKMCQIILAEKDKNQIIEIHNRPYLFKTVNKYLSDYPISIFLHNDPQDMAGSQTVQERQRILEKVTAIFCVSEFIKRKFLEGIIDNKNKVFVIHNGVPRQLKEFPQKHKEVIFVGRIVPEKGVDLYVKAISKIANNFPDWKFRLIGSTYLGFRNKQNNFEKNIIQDFLKIGNQGILDGFVNYQMVQKIMKKASIIIIPSKWDEPFGMVVAEAMSSGMAVITSKVGGIPEIIQNNGIILNNIDEFKIEEALLRLLKEPKLLLNFQQLSWNHFTHSSVLSSKKLDSHRKQIISDFF